MNVKQVGVQILWAVLLLSALPPLTRTLDSRAQQSSPRAELPGLVPAEQCGPAPFPLELPPLDSVLDTAAVAVALRANELSKPVVLALRLGALETTPRVRVIQTKAPRDIADRAAAAVDAALRPVPADLSWAFRVKIDVDRDLVFSLERSRVCGAIPPRPEVRTATQTVRADELQEIRREADEAAARYRAMRHRVLVAADGRVLAVELMRSSGDGVRDASGADRWKRAVFKPTKLDDVPVTAWVELRGDHGWRSR